ncbi:hypothetical protein Tco_0351274 [Tanacetum coccineum]
MSRIGMNILASKGNVPDIQKVDIYFCKPSGLGKQKKLSFIMLEKTRKLQGWSKAESTRLCAQASKMLWADSVSTAYLIYRIPYVPIGLRILEEEWRGKDTSLVHLKVFGCDSFVNVKDVCREAMKYTFIDDGVLPERGYSQFNDVSSGYLDTVYRKSPSPAFGAVYRTEVYTEVCAGAIYPNTIAPNEDEMQTLINMLNMLSSYKFDSTMKASTLTSAPTIAASTSLRIKDGIVELKSYMIEGEPWVYGVGFVTIKLSGKWMTEENFPYSSVPTMF